MPIEEAINKFTEFFNAYYGKKYDANPYSLCSAIFPCLRKCRGVVEDLSQTKDWYFCSEIVALLYKYMGIYPSYINEKDVTPRDIAFPEADTDLMPKILQSITYITTPLHYKKM
jgi:hypothetical protein